jgi:two-component system, cell cycle sensor histidine kinase and response regulator CckA
LTLRQKFASNWTLNCALSEHIEHAECHCPAMPAPNILSAYESKRSRLSSTLNTSKQTDFHRDILIPNEMESPLEEALQSSQREEAKLRAREDRLQISLDAANVGTWDWNIRTGEVRWSENLERIHGQSPGDFRGTFEGFIDGVHPDDRQRVLDAIQNATVTGETYEVEYRSPRSDGATMWLEGRGRVSRDEAGEPLWMSGICMDTTERHQLQDQLRQSQRLESLGVLAGGIAHDFNNLLTGILGNASLADERLKPGDPARPLIRNVVAASQRAAELTQQLLAYAGKGRVCVEPLDLGDLVRNFMPLVRPSIPMGVELGMDLAPAPIKADAGQIHQLVMNLVINAAEAISNAGTVLITTKIEEVGTSAHRLAPGKYACLKVSDTGCGMDQETLAHIFEPFFSTKFSGRGLGLAATLGIVHAHHGSIAVESVPGKGTMFTVWLPSSVDVPAAIQQPAAASDLAGSGVILVVDDEDLVLRIAKASLEAHGYTALLASDGRSALDVIAVSGDRIRLVLLDLTMPGMTSEETVKQLRATQPTMPVIITSGYGGSEIMERFEGIGINGLLPKPYTAEQLVRCINTALADDEHPAPNEPGRLPGNPESGR